MRTLRWIVVTGIVSAALVPVHMPPLRAAEQSWTGIISDSQCGADHGGEIDVRECTLKCTSQGDKYVLVVNRGTTVMPITNQDFADLPTHAGHQVTVTGELKDGAISISKIVM